MTKTPSKVAFAAVRAFLEDRDNIKALEHLASASTEDASLSRTARSNLNRVRRIFRQRQSRKKGPKIASSQHSAVGECTGESTQVPTDKLASDRHLELVGGVEEESVPEATDPTDGSPKKHPELASDKHLKVFLSIEKDSIRVPEDFQDEYQKWTRDWTTLFTRAGNSLRDDGDSDDILFEQYCFTKRLQQQAWSDRICIRFLILNYFNISQNDGGAEKTATTIAARSADYANTRETVLRWIELGQRWSNLCRDLGGYGILFLLPDIKDTSWLRIPLKIGAKRQAILGILQQSSSEQVAERTQSNKLGFEVCSGLLKRRSPSARLPSWTYDLYPTNDTLQTAGGSQQQPCHRTHVLSSNPWDITTPGSHLHRLAAILWALGSVAIPMQLINRARQSCLCWNDAGEAAARESNSQGSAELTEAVAALQCHNVIDVREFDGVQYVTLKSEVSEQLAWDSDWDECWKAEAIRAVFFTFPLDHRLQPLYYLSAATRILPRLFHILPHLTSAIIYTVVSPVHVIEICLSASTYAHLERKEELVAAAATVADHHGVRDVTILRRILLRQMVLSRITSCAWDFEPQPMDFPRLHQKSNGYYGEYVVFYAGSVWKSQGPDAALAELNKYEPWDPHEPSTLEKAVMYEMDVLRGKILHFSGRFSEAKARLEQTLGNKNYETRSPVTATAHLSAVCCELGQADLGIQLASDHLSDTKGIQSGDSRNAKRLRLTLASAYLLKAMSLWLKENALSVRLEAHLKKAHELYSSLIAPFSMSASRARKINRVSASLGLAAVAHLWGYQEEALTQYDSALEAAKQCQWDPGYIEAVIYSSKAVILYDLREIEAMRDCEAYARKLYVERFHFFTGFGTFWPDIIGRWSEAQGRQRVIPVEVSWVPS